MKYSILMPYYDRANQLANTLQNYDILFGHRKDFEFIIVEDTKHTPGQSRDLKNVVSEFPKLCIIHIQSKALNTVNPSIAYNEAFSMASGEFIVLTNPECAPITHILDGMDVEFSRSSGVYVVCSCLAFKENGKVHMWYQHSDKRNACYHFCTALSRENYKAVGGFDERYAQGYGYEDNAFRDAVKNEGIPFVTRDDLLVHHQWHPKVRPDNYRQLLGKNRKLYEGGS